MAAESGGAKKMRRTNTVRIGEAVKSLAICHNVTPVFESQENVEGTEEAAESDRNMAQSGGEVNYQASSPDEVALVKWSEEVGLALVDR